MNKDIMTQRILLLLLLSSLWCGSLYAVDGRQILPGAFDTGKYFEKLRGKNVAVVANQTSMIGKTHLVDSLFRSGIRIKAIFAPEHGFRDMADAGETITNSRDTRTGIQIISLYGKHLKPQAADLSGVDVLVYDIQDVGVRFYTYVSTLHYVAEACAENNIKLVILDRPNPNGYYVDGNIPDTAARSFVCMDPVPVVYGMTPGEYALMLNGEKWLKNGVQCDIEVVKCSDYNHRSRYELPVRPSPNLPDMTSVYLYPSLCFFEGTSVSVGRGTDYPFKVYGSPDLPDKRFSFTPRSTEGAKDPMYLGQVCFGNDLHDAIRKKIVPAKTINLTWLIEAYRMSKNKYSFFIKYFDVLAGGPVLRKQIESGLTDKQIHKSWEKGLAEFKNIRKKYLLYQSE
jgi:uncharacterized protein YbbC (DUF1343 family)